MSIKVEEFQQGREPSKEPRGATVGPEIEKFLQNNSEQGYRPKEVAEELGLNKATVTNTMNKMAKGGSLDKRLYEGFVYYRWVGKTASSEETSDNEDEGEVDSESESESESEEEEEYDEEDEDEEEDEVKED